ncbi:hypothetical protein CWE02_23025 [Brucella pituitosa]|nr:hypothetical protein [Ochrobactrum sp. XJ1]PJO45665.1 hypothetical protein CWE02_23025 [Brucella pituitosa]
MATPTLCFSLCLAIARQLIEWNSILPYRATGGINDECTAQQRRLFVARTSKVSKIQDEIARLQQQLDAERAKEAERLGSLAVKAGLADVEVSDRDLLKALKEVAERFQQTPAE